VRIEVDGKPRLAPGPLSDANRIVIENGHIRLVWHRGLCEHAAVEASVRVGASWVGMTAHCVGDWVYPAASVESQPTAIDLTQLDSGMVAVRLTFANHWFKPHALGFPSWYVAQRYPFHRTIWLRSGDSGYFTQIEMESSLLFDYPDVEHEVGFGGIWGPASVRTSQASYRTEALERHEKHNLQRQVEAAELSRDGDRLLRVLVPLAAGPMITPKFPKTYGGVYAYFLGPTERYGAFLYAASRDSALTARAVCRYAWTHSPFAVPAVTTGQLDACGPDPRTKPPAPADSAR